MPPRKRACDAEPADAAGRKRVRSSGVELELLDKEALVKQCLQLQAEIDLLETQKPKSLPVLSEDDVKEKVDRVRKAMVKGIKSQMKWKSSCKTGSARFSYSSGVASPQVFQTLFKLPTDSRKKMLQYSLEDFREIAAEYIRASVRYDYLGIRGENVTVRWKEDDRYFTVSGSSGK